MLLSEFVHTAACDFDMNMAAVVSLVEAEYHLIMATTDTCTR